MGWKERGNGRYYYRSKRIGGRVRTEYVGAGHIAALTAQYDLIDRICAENARAALRRTRAKDAAIDRQITIFRKQVSEAVAVALAEHGYRRHHRGDWRKSRSMPEQTQLTKPTPADDINVMASSVLRQILISAGVRNQKVQQALLGDVAAVRAQLGWVDAPGHERLLIEVIAVDWLRLQLVEQVLSQNSAEGGYKLATVDHLERRLSLAHRRYLESVMALAKVRRLAINVQINVGQNQVIAG